MTRGTLIKRGLVGAGALSGAALLAACGSDSSGGSTAAGAAGGADAPAGGKKRTIIWAVAAIAPWNLNVDIGFIEACNALGWKYQKVGVPIAEYSPETVVSTIRRATQAKPDVLVTPGWVPGAYTALEEAQSKGILCLLNDANNSPDETRRLGLGHVGADEKANGAAMGQALIAAAKRAGKSSGTFLFGNQFPGNANLEAHGAGLKQAAGSDYEVVVYKEPIDPAESLAGFKAQITKIGDDLVGICPTQEAPVVKALRESGKQPGDIIVGSFEDAVPTLNLVKEGWVTASVSSQRYSWGFVSTMLANQALERGVAAREYMTGAQVIDATNVDPSLEQAAQFDSLAKQYNVKLA
ncbi:MAG TPA: substrate-binding domain-containing protein [Conexibacter sp.]